MALKHHTILFVPHTRARFRKLRLTDRQLKAALAGLALLTLVSTFTVWSFFSTTVDRAELARIREQNRELAAVNETFESTLEDLERRLSGYEARTRELAIVAGIEGGAGGVLGTEAGVGGVQFGGADRLRRLQQRSGALERGLSVVEEGLSERLRRISSTPSIAPTRGVLTSSFGLRRDPLTGERDAHPGIDLASQPGAPVVASADGLVVEAGRNGELGVAITVSHGFGFVTRYGHLSRLAVTPGATVRRGDVIGYVGNTGRSTGYHLHYEVMVDGDQVNPLVYILDPPVGRS